MRTEVTREARRHAPVEIQPEDTYSLLEWSMPRLGDYYDFVPRSLLSVPPIAITPIVFEDPPGHTGVARYLGVLSLFIDEQGKVERIVADEPHLPPAFEAAAREAFMVTQFSPGQIDGRPVKSRQRVEVVFDNTPPQIH